MLWVGLGAALLSAAISRLGALWRQKGANDAPVVDPRRHGVTVIAVAGIASNVAVIPAGILVFGDPLDEGFEVVVRLVAFALVIAAAALLPTANRAAAE